MICLGEAKQTIIQMRTGLQREFVKSKFVVNTKDLGANDLVTKGTRYEERL